MTYLLMASPPSARMAALWAAWRLSVHQMWLLRPLRPGFRDREVETAGCPEIGDVPSLDLLDLE